MKAMLIVFAGMLAACSSDTGRSRTTFDFEVVGVGLESVNDHGFTVTVKDATVAVERVDIYEGAPLFARWWRKLSPIQTAYAHPGHYSEGDTLADVLNVGVVRLTKDRQRAGAGDGVTGAYRSAQVTMNPSPEIDGRAIRIEAEASKDGETIEFSGFIDGPLTVTGIAFGADVSESTGTLTMQVDVSRWFQRADFSALMSQAPPTFVLNEGHQPYNALVRGVENTAAFSFTWR